MQILKGNNNLPKHCVVTIGNFDGLHQGHMRILDLVKKLAKDNNTPSLLITFDPHPAEVFHDKELENHLITSVDKKNELLSSTGLDYVYIVDFNIDFACINARDFVNNFLVNKFKPSNIVVGYDHFFGNNKEGSFDLLADLSDEYGYKAWKVDKAEINGVDIKSQSIRRLILKGELVNANKLLGRNFSLCGKVIKGRGIGKTLLFPTANIKIAKKNQLLPADGVYSTEIIIKKNKKSYNSVCNIGVRPTFNDNSFKSRSIETHILSDENFDIYGYEVELVFKSRIRDEIKFDSKEDLVNQINLDKEYCMNSLNIVKE